MPKESASPAGGTGSRSLGNSSPKTLSAAAYERVRADIVSGAVKPGTKLLTNLVKQHYGIGGSPMREALVRLTAEGLVCNEGQKGFRVAGTSISELADIARLRYELEPRGLADSIQLGDVEWRVGVVSEFHRLQAAIDTDNPDPREYANQWEKAHRAFHFALLAACRSPWLLRFCGQLYDQAERYRRIYTAYQSIPLGLIASHEEIMNAALGRKVDLAIGLIRRHIAFAAHQTLMDMRKHNVPADPAAEAMIEKLAKENELI